MTSPTDAQHIRRLLLVQLKWMGDVILTTPAIREARRAFPDARIDFVTSEAGAAALEGNPHLDHIYVWRGRGIRHSLGLFREIFRQPRYDAAIDFRSTTRDLLFVLASRARQRIGVRGRGPRVYAYTKLFDKEKRGVYMARQKLDFLRGVGIEPDDDADLSLEMVSGPRERAWAQDTLARVGLAGKSPIVALSPVTRMPYKQWGVERWAEIGDLVVELGGHVLITSGPGELEQAQAVAAHMRHPAVYDYGRTNIRQLLALYEHCSLWVGNDGGAKHIAVSAGVPTISVFRWTTSRVWTDLSPGSPHRAIERPPILPCDLHCGDCRHYSCLEQVSPDDVAQLVRERMATATARL
jgi:ADP-heptose:LPS heptosyltransferase